MEKNSRVPLIHGFAFWGLHGMEVQCLTEHIEAFLEEIAFLLILGSSWDVSRISRIHSSPFCTSVSFMTSNKGNLQYLVVPGVPEVP